MRNSCCLLELVLSTKIKKQRKTLNRFQLSPCHCCCQNSSASLLGGQRGNVDHALATFANVSKLGRKELLPLSCLARYWSAKAGEQGHWTWPTECQACGYLWQNGKIELLASSLKTRRHLQLSVSSGFCFPALKNADLWEIMLNDLKKCSFLYYFSQLRGQQKAFVSYRPLAC